MKKKDTKKETKNDANKGKVTKDFKVGKKEIEKEIIKSLIDYLKYGVLPNSKPDGFVNAYTTINNLSDQGDKQSQELLNYHNQVIQNYILDCKKALNSQNNVNLIDDFLKDTDNIYFLIYLEIDIIH